MHWVIPRSFFGISAFLVVFFAVAAIASSATAQFPGVGATGITLVANPQFPAPESTVEVSLSDYSVDTIGYSIAWYVDGSLQTASANERTLRIVSGPLGKKTSVRALLTKAGTPGFSATLDIIPAQVDLIIEADTYVPNFYRGRALPSPESDARAIVVVHDGTTAPESSYTYTWSLDGEVLFGGPVRGKRAVDLTVSRFKNSYVTVKVVRDDGVTVGERSFSLEATEPQLIFYEHSPLRGLLERAVVSPFPLISEEVSVYGEPYFFHGDVTESSASFLWEINGEARQSTTDAPNAITLRRVGGIGEAVVGLQVVSKKRIPQVVEDAFKVFFE